MTTRSRLLLLVGLALMWGAFGVPGFSGATFTARTTATASISALNDWTPPVVAMTAPSSTVSGTTTVAATATDDRSGVASVAIAYAASGSSTWTTVCTDTTAPYSCSWDTTKVTDGSYQLRAVGTDNAGYSATSATVGTTVANTPTVHLTDPGDNLRGSVALSASLANPGGLAISGFRLRYSVADANSWTDITGCSTTSATLTCTWATPASNGYDLQAVAVVGGSTYTDLVQDVLVDNTAPSVSLSNLGTLTGVVSLTATASDADSGIASVAVQYAPAGTSTWTTACSSTVGSTTTYSCRFDSTKVSDGSYDFRAVATDYAGNTTASASQKKVTVNNAVASVSVESPGAYVNGTVTLNANANSTNGVANVAVQYAPHGGSTWTTVCTDTTSPYSCSWVTGTLAGGQYDLRAVMTDSKAIQTTSATVTVTVDNSPLRGLDVQTVNTGAQVGRLEAGDQIVFTYSGALSYPTLLAGWDGTSTTVTATVTDGALLSGSATDDTFGVTGVNLGSVDLYGNYVKKRKTVTMTSTMVATTATVNGVTTTVVTITLGAPAAGLTSTAAAAGTMVWTPSALAKNTAGSACSVAPASESGAADKEF